STTACDPSGFVDPVVDHDRTDATAIVGGVVYRGAAIPALSGKYVYADFNTGKFWSIPIDQAAPTPQRLDEDLPRVNPSSFALDASGEIVFPDYDGTIYRIVSGSPGAAPPAAPE